MTTGNKPQNKGITKNFLELALKLEFHHFLMIKINMENDWTPGNKQNLTNRFISDLFRSHYLGL